MDIKEMEIATEPPDDRKDGKTLVYMVLNDYTQESGLYMDGKMIPGVAGVSMMTVGRIHLINGTNIDLTFHDQIHTTRMWLDDDQIQTILRESKKASEK